MRLGFIKARGSKSYTSESLIRASIDGFDAAPRVAKLDALAAERAEAKIQEKTRAVEFIDSCRAPDWGSAFKVDHVGNHVDNHVNLSFEFIMTKFQIKYLFLYFNV